MNQRNAALAVGRNFTRFFQFAVVALMLAVFSGTALADHKIDVNKANAETLDEASPASAPSGQGNHPTAGKGWRFQIPG